MKKLQSRKFWAMIFGALLAAFGKDLGLSEAATQEIVILVGAYAVGQGIADHGKPAAEIEAAKLIAPLDRRR